VRRSEVGFTAYEDDGYGGTTDIANFFIPLQSVIGSAIIAPGVKERTLLDTFSRESGVSIEKAIKIT
jgi:hypothetical protein